MDTEDLIAIYSGCDRGRSFIAMVHPDDCPKAVEANARLIAAAPRMLRALRLALDCPDEDKARYAAEAAVAEAEGR